MNLTLTLDATAQAAPTAVKNAWQTAVNILNAAIADTLTLNLTVTYGVDNGTSGGASAGPSGGHFYSYSTVANALKNAATPGDSTFTMLPGGTTIGGQSSVAVWSAEEKLLGLGTGNASDGSADFGTGIALNAMVGVALHEFTHALGRVPFGSQPDILEFNRFTAPGTYLFTGNIPASASYFSLDGGVSRWADYGQSSDPSDTLNPPGSTLTPNDSFNEFYTPGSTLQTLTPFDLEQLDALGYHLKFNAPASDAHDFNGDNSADILAFNASNGSCYYGAISAGNFVAWHNLFTAPGFNVVGEGKISGNPSSDVVIQNGSGQIYYANVVNGSFSNWVNAGNTPGVTVRAVADVNDDHYADIIAQDTAGQIYFANMSGGTNHGWATVGSSVGNSISVKGAGDVNFDGYADVVIQSTGGQIWYANMANGSFSNWVNVANVPGLNVAAVGDVNRDGYADIVVQSSAGQIYYANMNGGTLQNWLTVGSPVAGWTAGVVANMMGNGYGDIGIQNQTTGQFYFADMTGGTFQGWRAGPSAPGYVGRTDGSAAGPLDAVSMFDPGTAGGALGPVVASDPGTAGGALGPVVASDPGPEGTSIGALTMFDPGVSGQAIAPTAMFDPGPQGASIGAVMMHDPAPSLTSLQMQHA